VTRRAALVVLGVGVVALLGWLGYRSVRPPTPGPLARDVAESLGIQRRVGETFTYGMPVVVNSGDEPAVLARIEPVDPTPGLQLLHTRISGSDRKYHSFSSGSWPDPSRFTDLHPVDGFVVHPESVKGWERGAELIFVMRADEPGRYAFNFVAVEYRVGGNEHRAVLEIGLGVCVTKGPKMPDKRCNDPPSMYTSRSSTHPMSDRPAARNAFSRPAAPAGAHA
jgi:hypothetical protein